MIYIKKISILFIFALGSLSVFAQTDTLVAPSPATRGGMTAKMASPKTAHGEVLRRKAIPSELGGGTTVLYKLVVKDVFKNKAHTFLPSDFGAKNLQLARWIDSRYFLFIGTDFVDITGYYLYDTERDQVHPCLYEVGESLGYVELKPGQSFSPVIRENEVSAFLLKP